MRSNAKLAGLVLGGLLFCSSAQAGPLAWVTCQPANAVSVVDVDQMKEVARIPVDGKPAGVAVSEPAGRVFVTSPEGKVLTILDIARRSVDGRIPLEGGPLGVAVDPKGEVVYVADWYNHRIEVVDWKKGAIVDHIGVGQSPSGLDITPDGALLLSADRDSDQVSFVDLATRKVVATVHVGIRPFGVTIEGAVVGTPRYMAPEQVAGGELTPATDLYALGAVIHQMMTGAHPFEGSTLAERFRHDPPSVRARRPDLPVAWDRAIARLLALDPAERFQCCEDLMNALDVERPARASTRVPPVGSNRSKLRAIGVALLGLFIAGALFAGTKSWHRQSVPVARNAVGARLCVAVLGFRNLGGNAESDWLSTAFSEAIRAELAGGGQLRLLSGEDVARMKRELALPESDSLSREALVHVRRDLDADVLVLGSYLVIGASGSGRVRLDLEIQDTRNGETVASQVINGTEPAFMDVVAEAGRRLRGALGVAGITDEEEKAVRAALPLDLHALRLYAEGLVRLRACNPPGAHEQLEKAALIDPGNPMIHAALAEALASMGETDRARAEAEKAFARATSMSREERIVIEARYRRLAEEWEDAIRLYRTLFQSFPDNPSYGLALAEVQTAARKPKDVEVTLEKLRRLPGAVEDPRIDLAAAGATEDGQTARIMLAGAARKAEARGAKALVARARASEASVLFQLGEYKEAIAIGEAAGNLADAAGERQSRLMALTALSNAASAFGELKYAAAVQDEVLALLTSLGRKRQAAMAAIDAARLYLRSGNLMAAAQRAREAERLTRESPARGSIGTVLVSEAEIELAAGRLPEARKHAEDAIEAFRGIDDDLHNAWAWSVLGEVLTEQGDFAEARKRLEQSLAWRERMDRKVFAAESRLALAKLAFDEGDPIAAKPFARDALVAFRDGKADDGAALAAAVLARALVTREPDQALRIVEEAAHASAASENPRSRFALTLANALVRDAMQHRATLSAGGTASPTGHDNVTEPMFDDVVVPAPLVVEPLNVVIDEAHRLGLLRDEWDARLAIAIVEIRDGRNAAAAGRARAVEADARRLGFLAVAAHAARLQRGQVY